MTKHDPSQTSHYVSNEWYEALVSDFSDWQSDDAEITEADLRDACRRLLEKEARLLDENRLDDWLKLYAPECAYWVPATPDGGDPRKEIAVCFDDRRRLEDRIFRLQNDYAWSQRPVSRTARMLSGIALYRTSDANEFMARTTFYTTEFQAGDWRRYTGWYGHRLRRTGGQRNAGWEILIKQVNLIDCDQNLRNLSVIL